LPGAAGCALIADTAVIITLVKTSPPSFHLFMLPSPLHVPRDTPLVIGRHGPRPQGRHVPSFGQTAMIEERCYKMISGVGKYGYI
jgi:hypothetical protein